jgi:hypothetical protein
MLCISATKTMDPSIRAGLACKKNMAVKGLISKGGKKGIVSQNYNYITLRISFYSEKLHVL